MSSLQPIRKAGRASWLPGARRLGTAPVLLTAAAFMLGWTIPSLIGSNFYLTIGGNGLMLALPVLGVAFMMQQLRLAVFGAASFFGGAGYLFAICNGVLGWSAELSVAASLAGTLVAAAGMGLLIVRTQPLAFMMLTLAFNEMLNRIVLMTSLRPLTGGEDGLVVAFQDHVFGFTQAELADPATFWRIGWVACFLAGGLIVLVVRARLGKILRAIRENEERMRFSGFDTYGPRLIAFLIMSLLAAVSGLLTTLHLGFVSPEAVSIGQSGDFLVAALLGGTGSTAGPFVGSLVFVFAQDWFGAQGYLQLFMGVAIIVVLGAFPRGLAGLLRIRPASRKGVRHAGR